MSRIIALIAGTQPRAAKFPKQIIESVYYYCRSGLCIVSTRFRIEFNSFIETVALLHASYCLVFPSLNNLALEYFCDLTSSGHGACVRCGRCQSAGSQMTAGVAEIAG